METLGNAPIKAEGKFYLPWHPNLSNFLINGDVACGISAIREELLDFLDTCGVLKDDK